MPNADACGIDMECDVHGHEERTKRVVQDNLALVVGGGIKRSRNGEVGEPRLLRLDRGDLRVDLLNMKRADNAQLYYKLPNQNHIIISKQCTAR